MTFGIGIIIFCTIIGVKLSKHLIRKYTYAELRKGFETISFPKKQLKEKKFSSFVRKQIKEGYSLFVNGKIKEV